MDIPPATERDTAFKIGDTLTIYEAAMVYAGRHPYPRFFAVKGGSVEEHIEHLKLGVSDKPSRKRSRAQRSWDICCELMKRIEQGKIKPVKISYDQSERIDLSRTQIKTSDLVCLAQDRGEKPRYLRPLLELIVPAKTATQTAPGERAASRADMQVVAAEYEQRVKDVHHSQGRYPNRQEDLEWGKEKSLKREAVTELRSKYIPDEVRKGGRPKSRKPDKK